MGDIENTNNFSSCHGNKTALLLSHYITTTQNVLGFRKWENVELHMNKACTSALGMQSV